MAKKKGLPPEVAAALREARETHSDSLNLNGQDLAEIPEEVFGLTDLERLYLSDNELRTIPERLWQLPKLQSVSLIGNPVESLPDRPTLVIDGRTYLRCHDQVAGKNLRLMIDEQSAPEDTGRLLTALRTAGDLRDLSIYGEEEKPGQASREFLASLASLDFLEGLFLYNLKLDAVPEGVRRLTRLQSLTLNHLGLKTLPEWIAQLHLVALSAFGNALSGLPPLPRSLESIDVSHNPLERLPTVLLDLSSLRHLDVAYCWIREIPEDILSLPRLESLVCYGNPLESPPAEVADKGLQAIRDYWRQRADTGVDYLCEAKLIILGEAGAGKTSLARKIEDPGYQLREREQSTEGIDVIGYRFETAVRAREEGKERMLPRTFQVNIWDFGGQEIYHTTHQFFLTRRSVYVLVCDDRKEDTDFSYWLHAVEMLSDGSPLLIVQNQKQDRTRDINAGSLRARFSNLRGVLPVNLDTNRGLDGAVQSIRRELEGLPHVGVGLPATWKRVREALERDPRDYLPLAEYLEICQQHGFTRREDKLQLSGYLHDLGICLHFQDDPLLKNTVILKPSWGTDAVYRVLDDAEVIAARGRFTRRQLDRIWSEEKYAGMQDELLGLMMKFQLCYALESGREWIAPQLLSSEQPSYRWEPAGGLVMRYEYAFLPKGIVTRLIVALHRLIAGGTLVWKTGVVLERDGNRAEVLEEYAQRRIRVRVSGPDPRGLLAIVDEQLDRLHASFPRLQYEKYLPCPCSECREKAEPYEFAFEKLVKRAGKRTSIQCHDSGEMIDAERLVREIAPGALERGERPGDPAVPDAVPQAPPPVPEVFVSYAWTAESSAFVDRLQQALGAQGIRLLRDREEVRYKDSIRDFMRRIGQGKCVVVVVSEKYLKSENCMFELVEIEKARGLRDRIFPIVLPDANVYKAAGRVGYVRYWEEQRRELDDALKTVPGDNLTELQADLNVYAEIRRLFDGIAGTLRDMNALTPDQHEGTGFDELIGRIQAQLGV
jgi:internalin A